MRYLNETHHLGLRSRVESANAPASDFPIQKPPFGVFRRRGTKTTFRCSVAIGAPIVDLPLGYHGRTSSLMVSGETFHEPTGQRCRR